MNLSILETVLSVLFAALAVGVLFRYFHLPTILGYLLVGAIAGPHAFGLIPDEDNIKNVAEFGIVLLMFTVGLEFSLPKLVSLRIWVFCVGSAQVFLAILITTVLGIWLGMSAFSAFIIGGIVAMSSTAIVMKQLTEQGEMYSKPGLNAIGILLFQDLAVIPFIILIASFSAGATQKPIIELLLAALNILIAFMLIFIGERWLLKPIFRIVSAVRAAELFTFLVLLVALATSWLTHLLGLSYALGAFLAGVMLSETEFKHQIEVEIRPFRDILLGLFFITIGMLVDVSSWFETWAWIVLLVAGLIIGKALLITLLARLAGDDFLTSLRTGLIMAQGGEFGFVILTFAMIKELLPVNDGQVVLTALWISIAIGPLLIRYNERIARKFLPKKLHTSEEIIETEVAKLAHKLDYPIILCGFGHVGQHIACFLEIEKIPYIGLDLDPLLVKNARLAGRHVTYGDASHPGILKAARIVKAKALVISFSDLAIAKKILSLARQLNETIPILIRCKDASEINELKKHGATKVIAEVFEEGISLAHHLFQAIHFPEKKIVSMINQVRNTDYDMLRGIFSGSFDDLTDQENMLYEQLRPIILSKDAYAINRQLNEFNLHDLGVKIISIKRGKSDNLKPKQDLVLLSGDILVLFGKMEQLEKVEKCLLEGERS